MDRVHFTINGKQHSAGREISSDLSLLDYLRVSCELRGTKYMCREGGCGACVVSAARPGEKQGAVNSCLVSLTSCQDWDITTIEGIGNRLIGYHPIQKTLAKLNGTQCGYCSPGWVMAMYSLLQSKKDITMLEIEKSFGSNICRCTGYRPILEAFKKFASDAPKPDNATLDIEDLNICKKSGKTCRKSNCSESEWCLVEGQDLKEPQKIEIDLKDGRSFTKVYRVDEIFEVLKQKGDDDYMFVAGNTAKGAFPMPKAPRVLIDINSVNELKGYHLDQNLILGAGCTLNDTIEIFKKLASTEDNFWYLRKLQEHLQLVAHIPVRNLGTVAGNLMIKHKHNEFQSDVFLLLETIGAYMTILDSSKQEKKVTIEEFLKVDMRSKLIKNILLPPLGQDYQFESFKVMPRAQSAHAIVNAGFLYRLDSSNKVQGARIVYGAMNPHFVHASKTEGFLIGKKLFTNQTLQDAIDVLKEELVVEENPPEFSAEYRKKLAINLFFKGLLALCPEGDVDDIFASGGIVLSKTRPVSKAEQDYSTNPLIYPLNQPVEKVEALIQCAGEAPYSEDLPSLPHEVFGAFVLATVPKGDIDKIDPSEALKHEGVVAFYSADDIPGVNGFTPGLFPKIDYLYLTKEELFCSGDVKYHGHVIGVVVAETRSIAEYAAKLVHVTYKNVTKPVLDVREAIKFPDRKKKAGEQDGTSAGGNLFKLIKGKQAIFEQQHFCMETLVSVAKPTEEGLEVHCTTQHMDLVQMMISRALKMQENKIDVIVRRLGGGYGMKISRSSQVAVASALVAHKLNRPCRIILPFTTLAKAVGKRLPCYTEYEIAVDLFGKIQLCKETLFMDNGHQIDEPLFLPVLDVYSNCYDKLRWIFLVFSVTTDKACNTWCRSPGTLEAIAACEFILERVAYEMSLDPLAVRLVNLNLTDVALVEMVEKVKHKSDYANRRAAVDKFNKENRWKKKGLRWSLLKWVPFYGQYFDVTMSVYNDDGSVSITHGGIEMGQGLNTKAVQIASHFLGIPMDKIQIKANHTHMTPNSLVSGGSLTSINVGIGVQRCCEILLARLAPLKIGLLNPTWDLLVKLAYKASIDLQAHAFVSLFDTQKYEVHGVTVAEVLVDILTGEWELLRVDLMEDAGMSISPSIDVGQVEGAFIMGLGYWTTEHMVYDQESGEVLSDRPWNYHVPQARDIPQDFRVYFKDKSYSEKRTLGAKSIGEPPMCISVVVPLAIREAIASARCDAGKALNEWFQIDGPYTREAIHMHTETDCRDFRFKKKINPFPF
ncbi:indole-3-acetaldehyde oxidase-like isoform X2 [Leguminivora glycinivorella]|uniref:indole-3-acetaldehyde oxidase-like isoform X2 n=1 Tax=Leguminivora glycinivorella TaxID=1035111 RepID=UPI00200E3173|nr:indole-3-acetaldehyde oxidase-like isoform X2 [Leguminivora glycinivorella]